MNGDQESTPPAGASERFLNYLPSIYRESYGSGLGTPDDASFTRRFLGIFEDTLAPIEEMIDHLPRYFEPAMAPAATLAQMKFWLDIESDSRMSDDYCRHLMKTCIELHKWRGTRKGLEDILEVCLGARPEVEDFIGTTGGGSARTAYANTLTITFNLAPDRSLDEELARHLIEREKPAHMAYVLRILSDASPTGGADV